MVTRICLPKFRLYDKEDKLGIQFDINNVFKIIRAYPSISFIENDSSEPIIVKIDDKQSFGELWELIDRDYDLDKEIEFENQNNSDNNFDAVFSNNNQIVKHSSSVKIQIKDSTNKKIKMNWNYDSDDNNISGNNEAENTEESKNDIDEESNNDVTPKANENSNISYPTQSRKTFLDNQNSKNNSKLKKKPSFKNFKSVIPLLSDINEFGKINFKVKLLRSSGKYTPMILILHKKDWKIYITDATRYSLAAPIMASILGGDDIFQGHAPAKIIDIDSIVHIESSAFKEMTVFIKFTYGKNNKEKEKEVVFYNRNDQFWFLSVLSSIQCSLFDAPMNQIKAKDLTDVLQMKLFTFNMARKGNKYDFDRLINEVISNDIVVFAFQECKLTAKGKIIDMLNNKLMENDFDIVNSINIWEMILIVAIRNTHRHAIGNIRVFSKAKGFAGVIGNKAGLGITFSVYDSLFTVFNVHLHWGQSGKDKRIEMMNSLIDQNKLGEDSIDVSELSDYTFILGDFNFRMDTTYSDIINDINYIHSYMSLDEFHSIQKENKYYCGFYEGKKVFNPTYKREHKSDGYINKKEQPPSWTDRILIKNAWNNKLRIIQYSWLEDFYGSDHRPVFAELEIPLKLPDYFQLLRGQFTQESLQTDLECWIQVNSFTLSDMYPELLWKGGSEKLVFPIKIKVKFVGSWLSSNNETSSLSQAIKSMHDLQEDLVFDEKHIPPFLWIPNTVSWIKQWRLIAVVSFESKGSTICGYWNIPLSKIEEKGLSREIAKLDLVSSNTKWGTVKTKITYFNPTGETLKKL